MEISLVCGFDEAGRGPLAGPVTAGAVILPKDFPVEILNDSKKLSEKKRDSAEKIIMEKSCWGIGIVDHETIDKINILQASMYAMKIAYEMMKSKLPEWLKAQGGEFAEIAKIAETRDNDLKNSEAEYRAESNKLWTKNKENKERITNEAMEKIKNLQNQISGMMKMGNIMATGFTF